MKRESYLVFTQDLDGIIFNDKTSTCVFDTAATRDRLHLIAHGCVIVDSVAKHNEYEKTISEKYAPDPVVYAGHREVLDLGLPHVKKIYRNIIHEQLGGEEQAPPIPSDFVLKHSLEEFDQISNLGVTFETWVKINTEIGADTLDTTKTT